MPVLKSNTNASRSIQNTGVGLRPPHFSYITQTQPDIPWFEILIDNYIADSSALFHLEKICNKYPITFHSVGMSLGSVDKININYLKKLKTRINQFEPVQISDHLCWSSFSGQYTHDLLPLPYIEQAINTTVNNIKNIQDFLGQRILIENVSSYLSYQCSEMSEWEFLTIIAEQSDCDILLDINNIYVSAFNQNFNTQEYLDAIPISRVKEIHLAGYQNNKSFLLDTHSTRVQLPVWQLYQKALTRFGKVPTLIEWDNDIPDFSVLIDEALKADRYLRGHKINVILNTTTIYSFII